MDSRSALKNPVSHIHRRANLVLALAGITLSTLVALAATRPVVLCILGYWVVMVAAIPSAGCLAVHEWLYRRRVRSGGVAR